MKTAPGDTTLALGLDRSGPRSEDWGQEWVQTIVLPQMRWECDEGWTAPISNVSPHWEPDGLLAGLPSVPVVRRTIATPPSGR